MILKYSATPASRVGMIVHIDEIRHGDVFKGATAQGRYFVGSHPKVRYNNWMVGYPFRPTDRDLKDSIEGYFSEFHPDLTDFLVKILDENVFI